MDQGWMDGSGMDGWRDLDPDFNPIRERSLCPISLERILCDAIRFNPVSSVQI